MDNNNRNENLTPDELVEKLKEKLAIDNDTYSRLVDESSLDVVDDASDDINNADATDAVAYDVVYDSDDNSDDDDRRADDAYDVDEVYDADESDDVDEASDITVADVIDVDEADDIDLAENDADRNTDNSDDVTDDYLDERIKEVLDDYDGEYNKTTVFDTAINDNDKTSVNIPVGMTMDKKVIEGMEETTVFASATDSIEDIIAQLQGKNVTPTTDPAVNTVAASHNDSTEEKNIKKPSVYRFRRYDPNEEQMTKLNSAVFDDETDGSDDDKAISGDVPELEKPDLKVMQTFGATVDHVRELYGDEVADEYELLLANSDINERQAAEYEFTSNEQKHEIFGDFKAKMLNFKSKIFICSILCGLMFLLENLGFFGLRLGGIFDAAAYPVSYIMIDLQLLLICAALAFSVLKDGVLDIFALEPSSKSVVFAIFAVTAVSDVVACFIGGNIFLYNFSAGIAILLSIIFEAKTLKRDYMTFRILSSEKQKTAAVVCVGTSRSPEVALYEQIDDEEEVKIINIQRGKFVKDFFARTKQSDSSSHDKIVLPLTVAMMIILFVISFVLNKDTSSALQIATMSFSAFLPFAVYFSLCFPISKATTTVYESGAAIVGDAALEEYSGASIISFEDKDIFPSYCVKLKSVKVFGESRIDRVLYYSSSVFSKLGGPLSDVFSLATIEIGTSDDVEIISADDDGIEAKVDGKRILVGKASFMSKFGIYPKNDESDTAEYAHMYIAEEDLLCAKFYIKYALDVDFENTAARMTECNICGIVKTFDPNIDDKMLASYIDTSKYPIKVLKCKPGDDIGVVQEELDSGIVSIGGAKNAVDATVTCERLYNIKSTVNLIKIVSMIIGMLICMLIAIFGVSGMYSMFVVLYQLLWMLPALILGKFIYKVI